MMAKSIKGHTDFAVGFQQQDITFVYVKDVVAAVFLALTPVLDGVDALRGELVAHVGHDEADRCV